MSKILICGSHFTSAQAVIEQMLSHSGIEISYVGRLTTMEGDKSQSVESQIIPKLGVKYYTITTGRLSRSWGLRGLLSVLKIPVGFVQAFHLLLRINPDVVLSFGGYVSVPVVVVAKLMGKPVVLHEQTLVSGLANRVCGWFADKIAISYPDGKYEFAKNKMVLTGNPIRKDLLSNHKDDEITKFLSGNKKVVYITGGNQGAMAINQAIEAILPVEGVALIWQTGDSKFGNFEKAMNVVKRYNLEKKVLVRKWFDAGEVGQILKRVDLVICRAGINTLNELAYFDVRAIVVPYPYLYKNEQMVNAHYFGSLGLVKIIPQNDLNPDNLLVSIRTEIEKGKANLGKKVVVEDAAEKICSQVLAFVGKND